MFRFIIILSELVPQLLVWLLSDLVAVLLVHSPEAEAVHYFSQSVVIVIEFDGSCHVEHDF